MGFPPSCHLTPLRKQLSQTITTAAVTEIFHLTDRSLHAPYTAHRKALCSLSKDPQQYLTEINVPLLWWEKTEAN